MNGALYGLAAAALFGASAPICKRLLDGVGPLMLSALLYLGAGLGISIIRFFSKSTLEARIERRDVPALAVIVLFGGVVGPLLMLTGLARVSGVAGSLLLNLEAPFTMGVALVVFREHLDRRAKLGAAGILFGAALLGYRPAELSADLAGALAIAGACLAWAIDNNASQRVSLKDPLAIVQVKTLGAGSGSLALAFIFDQPLPDLSIIAGAMLLGTASYGVSLVLDMRALRLLGAAREAAYFATAPFIGALLAIPLLGERPSIVDAGAATAMIAGVLLLRSERHGHPHTHDALDHDHLHTHDAHHQHAHPGPITEPHSHPHHHEPMTHEHPHVSDLHHRHRH